MLRNIIAHRGGGRLVTVDNAMSSYRAAQLSGIEHIECDVQLTSDGFPVCIHDTTVDAVTSSTGNVSALTLAQFKALTIDCASFLASGYINEQPVSFEDFIIQIINQPNITIWPEAKVGGAVAAIVGILNKYKFPRNRVIIQSFLDTECAVAVNAGYTTAYGVVDATAADFKAIASTGVSYVYASNWTTPSVSTAKFNNLGVISYTINSRVGYAIEKNKGVDYIFSDDPHWITRSYKPLINSPFTVQQYTPGMDSAASRGSFLGGAKFGYTDATLGGYAGTRMGWGCPIKNADDADIFTIDLTACITAVNGGDSTRHLDFFICAADDTMFGDNGVSGTISGYNLLIRQNGTIQIYKNAAGAAATLLAQTTGSALTLGQEYPVKISVDKAKIKLELTSVPRSVEFSDTSFRGGYWHFGRNGAAGYIKNVIIA